MVITFLPRSKCLLISWLQSPSTVILEPKKVKSDTVSTVSPSISHEMVTLRHLSRVLPSLLTGELGVPPHLSALLHSMLTACSSDSEVRVWGWPFRCWMRKTDSEAPLCIWQPHLPRAGSPGRPVPGCHKLRMLMSPSPLRLSGPSWEYRCSWSIKVNSVVSAFFTWYDTEKWVIYRKYKCFLKPQTKCLIACPACLIFWSTDCEWCGSWCLLHQKGAVAGIIPIYLWTSGTQGQTMTPHLEITSLEEEANLKICHLPPGHFFSFFLPFFSLNFFLCLNSLNIEKGIEKQEDGI